MPVPFDALEFDEELGTMDVGYDLAFLLMDLDLRVGRPAANRVLNRYIARTGDAALSRALPLFLSVRAMVRAHVQATSGNAEAARQYLALAVDCLKPIPPIVVAIGGMPGSGKSTLARRLAPSLGRPPGAVLLRSDEIRKRAFEVAPEQRLPLSAYTESVDAAVSGELVALTGVVAGGGHAVIADATFVDYHLRQTIAGAGKESRTPFVGIWLTAHREILEARLSSRRNDASDATPSILTRVLAKDHGVIGWLHVDATDGDAAAAEIGKAVEGCLRLTGAPQDGS